MNQSEERTEIIDRKICEFERYRDEYFLKNPTGSYEARELALRQMVKSFIDELSSYSELSKSDQCYYSGKALNVLSDYDSKCEEYLARAVKLSPNSVESTNELGLCLWKKPDLNGAKRCFETALAKGRNKVSLRSLSVLYRHESSPADNESRSPGKNDCTKIRDVFERCLNLAREAAELDPTDGCSWYIVGNSYLTSFFGSAQCKGGYMRSALDSYSKALEDEYQQHSAELFLNRGIALKYEEDYHAALESFERASRLDPFFASVNVYFQNLLLYLERIMECVSKKGKIKNKRLQEMCSSICQQVDLGPYGGGYKVKTVGGDEVQLRYLHLKDLTPGRNEYAVVLLKVVGVVVNEDTIPYTFCGIDATGVCTVVTVYNFSQRFGVAIGNTVAILEPYYAVLDFQFREKKFTFTTIRVPTPEILVVNRKKLGRENCAVANVILSQE